jgi:hypothetical protein
MSSKALGEALFILHFKLITINKFVCIREIRGYYP